MAWVFSEDGKLALNLDRYERAKVRIAPTDNKGNVHFEVAFGRLFGEEPQEHYEWHTLSTFDTEEEAEEFLSEAFLYARGGGWSR